MKKMKTVSIGHPFHIEMLRTLSAMAAIWAKARGAFLRHFLSLKLRKSANSLEESWFDLRIPHTPAQQTFDLRAPIYSLYLYLTCFILFLLKISRTANRKMSQNQRLQPFGWMHFDADISIAACPGAPPVATSLVAFSEQTKARLTAHIRNAWKLRTRTPSNHNMAPQRNTF